MPELRSLLLVNYEYPPLGGGGGVFTRDLAEALVGQVQVTVLTSGAAGLSEQEDRNGVTIHRVPVLMRNSRHAASLASLLSFFPSSLHRGRRLLRAHQYDLVHSFFVVPSACSGMILARRAGVPHVLSVLGGDIYDPSKRLSPHRTPLLSHTVRRLLNRSDRVVSLSEDIRKRALSLYRLDREIDVIPLAVVRPAFTPVARDIFGFSKDDILLITIGRLVARKGVERLLGMLAQIHHPRLRLAIVGDGPLRSELERKASALDLGRRVRFLGAVSDAAKWQLLNLADIYVSTSIHEGFGVVFLEALESGLPIVCYDEGGQVDFLEDEQTAFLVRRGAEATFTGRLLQLCDDEHLRRVMGERGKATARLFRIDGCAERYLAIYRAAVGATPSTQVDNG
jgi:glycosyltransferase involved in cell wall biosynthesis